MDRRDRHEDLMCIVKMYSLRYGLGYAQRGGAVVKWTCATYVIYTLAKDLPLPPLPIRRFWLVAKRTRTRSSSDLGVSFVLPDFLAHCPGAVAAVAQQAGLHEQTHVTYPVHTRWCLCWPAQVLQEQSSTA